jgi:hypothetical protein
VAVGADGAIMSTANTELYLSPHAMVPRVDGALNLPDADILPMDNGGVRIKMNSGIGDKYFSIPVSTYGTLFGTQMYVKGLEVCYKVSVLEIVWTGALKNPGAATGYTTYLEESVTHDSTGYDCYTVAPPSSLVALDDSSWVQFNINFNAVPPAWVDIYTVKLTLSQQQD